jgi:hypothetical protein
MTAFYIFLKRWERVCEEFYSWILIRPTSLESTLAACHELAVTDMGDPLADVDRKVTLDNTSHYPGIR